MKIFLGSNGPTQKQLTMETTLLGNYVEATITKCLLTGNLQVTTVNGFSVFGIKITFTTKISSLTTTPVTLEDPMENGACLISLLLPHILLLTLHSSFLHV